MIEETLVNDDIVDLLMQTKSYLPKEDLQKVIFAVEFAKKAHEGQIRRSGEPYITHSLRTALILTRYHADEDTLIAAILHDIPENAPFTISDIEKNFGKKIAYLVDGITKLSKVHYRHDMERRQIESLKKLFIHCAEDLRVILIKLADRLHNMRTLQYITDENKRIRIAKETLEIYVPIANLLGISEIRIEMEDFCFQYLYPQEYEKLKKEISEGYEERNFILNEVMHLAEKELQKEKIAAKIIGRHKSLYGIFLKLQNKKKLNNINDLIAVKVVVKTRKDCYMVLGIIHKLFKPKLMRFKDYIAMPKLNGYQSLHTTVFSINGTCVEFQIRTNYMDLEAEYGIAAHYFYKYSDEKELAKIMRQRTSWVKRILELQKEKSTKEFIENLKIDVLQDRIFVFTPEGDPVDLPKGASCIDFAYAIHTDIGNHALRAEINGVNCPLTTQLSSGDTAKIDVSKNKTIEVEWLNFVKTNLAANKIRVELKKLPEEKKYLIGKQYLQKEFNHIGRNFYDELTGKKLKTIEIKFNSKNINELLTRIAEGTLHPREILKALYGEKLLVPKEIFKTKELIPKKGFISRIGLKILGYNLHNKCRDILRILNALKIPIIKFNVDSPWYIKYDRCRLTILVKDYNELCQVFESLEQIEGIKQISRTIIKRKILFAFWSIFSILLWISHPILMTTVSKFAAEWKFFANILLYSGIILLFWLILYLRRITERTIPELGEAKYYWPVLFVITSLAFLTVLAEIIFFKLIFNWVFIFGLIFAVYVLLLSEYIQYRSIKNEIISKT